MAKADDGWKIACGDVRKELSKLPPHHFHCMVTSPPYFQLRDYDLPRQVWGGDAKCKHQWGPQITRKVATGSSMRLGRFCKQCEAWEGSLGLEPTPDLFVEHFVEVMRSVRRVLRKDGVCYIVIGDSYWDQGSRGGIKPGDLIGIPWRLGMALQADGWYLRCDIIYSKKNPTPESVSGWSNELVLDKNRKKVPCEKCEDGSCGECWDGWEVRTRRASWRPTKSHEYVLMLTPSRTYFCDQEAVREEMERSKFKGGRRVEDKANRPVDPDDTTGRNPRSVWTHATYPFKEAHFAVYSEGLIVNPILSATSDVGCCPTCGAAWVRVMEKTYPKARDDRGRKSSLAEQRMGKSPPPERGWEVTRKTIGWVPSCDCSDHDPIPCRVLDPFVGTGTTIIASRTYGRECVGVELSREYCDMARKRIRKELRGRRIHRSREVIE